MIKKTSALAVIAALLALAPAAAEDMTLDDLLTAHFETIGSEDAWRSLETAKMTGTMTFQTPQGPIEAPVSMWFDNPDKFRMEFTVQGMTGIQAYDGETAWWVMPFMGKPEPEEVPAELAEQMSEQADLNPFLDWQDKGYELELVGKEEVEGTEAYKIKLTRMSGNVRHYYLDTDHFLPFRVEGKTKFQGQEIDSFTTLGEYKEVGDVVLAHSIEMRQGSADSPPQVLTISDIETNTEIPASKFDMQAAMPKPAAEPEKEDPAEEPGG